MSSNHYPYTEIETFHYNFITSEQIEGFCNLKSSKQKQLPYYYDLDLGKIDLLSKTNVTPQFVRIFK